MFTFARRKKSNDSRGSNHEHQVKEEETKEKECINYLNDIRDDEDCKNLCLYANIEFLQCIHDHVIEYLNESIIQDSNSSQDGDKDDDGQESDDNDSHSKSSCSKYKRRCSYEDWIRKCHPENTSVKDIDKKYHGYDIDHRFYLRDSDHRIIWNGYVHAFGCPELKVRPESRVKDLYCFQGMGNVHLEKRLGVWGIEQ